MPTLPLLAVLAAAPEVLWHDVTSSVLPATAEWTNRVALADIDGDGRVDLLFANGGNYSDPGKPELNRVFLNRVENGELRFEEKNRNFDRGSGGRVVEILCLRVRTKGCGARITHGKARFASSGVEWRVEKEIEADEYR